MDIPFEVWLNCPDTLCEGCFPVPCYQWKNWTIWDIISRKKCHATNGENSRDDFKSLGDGTQSQMSVHSNFAPPLLKLCIEILPPPPPSNCPAIGVLKFYAPPPCWDWTGITDHSMTTVWPGTGIQYHNVNVTLKNYQSKLNIYFNKFLERESEMLVVHAQLYSSYYIFFFIYKYNYI